MSYCTVDDVKNVSGVKPERLGNQFKDDEAAFNALINELLKLKALSTVTVRGIGIQ